MNPWDKISLFKFQQIDEISKRNNIDDLDRSLFCTCAVFGLTEYQLDSMPLLKAEKLIVKAAKIFNEELTQEPFDEIGIYKVNYVPSTFTFGQFIALAYYASENPLQLAHMIMAVLVDVDADHVSERADYFRLQPITKIIGSLKLFLDKFKAFNLEYKDLFGVSSGIETKSDPFLKRFGWIFSATRIATHKGITLDDSYKLPIREAFNDLAYLKAKDKYDEQQFKKK